MTTTARPAPTSPGMKSLATKSPATKNPATMSMATMSPATKTTATNRQTATSAAKSHTGTTERDRAAADRRLAALADELARRDSAALAERESRRPTMWLLAMTLGAVALAQLAVYVMIAPPA